jgi:hypothetical protein
MSASHGKDLAPAGPEMLAFDICVAAQAWLVELFKRQGHAAAFLAARDELEAVRSEREVARRLRALSAARRGPATPDR